jgi:predicted DNA repair protein MutK
MSTRGFYLLDEDGVPEAYIDKAQFAAEERRISSLLAANSRDSAAVMAIIARELQDQSTPEQVRTLLTLGVLHQLTVGVVGPMISLLALTETSRPNNHHAGDSLARTPELLQGGPNTPEGLPSDGAQHV